MKNDQYAAKGETFVMEEDPSKNGFYRPLVIREKVERRGRWGSNRSYSLPSRDTSFWDYDGYTPYWYQNMRKHNRNRWKFLAIVLIVSHVLNAKLPALLSVLVQP
jgi:hypothetical protein